MFRHFIKFFIDGGRIGRTVRIRPRGILTSCAAVRKSRSGIPRSALTT